MTIIGVQIPTRADIVTKTTSIKSKFIPPSGTQKGQVALTIAVTIDDAKMVDVEPEEPKYSLMRYISGSTDIETTSKSADYATLEYQNGKLRLIINMGIGGKIGGASDQETLLSELRELIKEWNNRQNNEAANSTE